MFMILYKVLSFLTSIMLRFYQPHNPVSYRTNEKIQCYGKLRYYKSKQKKEKRSKERINRKERETERERIYSNREGRK